MDMVVSEEIKIKPIFTALDTWKHWYSFDTET